MSNERSSTGMEADKAIQGDTEVQRLIRRVGRRYQPDDASRLIDELIIQSFSTSALTAEFGPARPGGLAFFKAGLKELADDDAKGE